MDTVFSEHLVKAIEQGMAAAFERSTALCVSEMHRMFDRCTRRSEAEYEARRYGIADEGVDNEEWMKFPSGEDLGLNPVSLEGSEKDGTANLLECPSSVDEVKAEESCHTHNVIEEGEGSQTAEVQDFDGSRLANNDEAKDLEKTHADGLSPHEKSESSLVKENDIINSRDDSAVQKAIGNEGQNDEVVQIPVLRPQERSEPSLQNDFPSRRDDSGRQLTRNEEQNDGMMRGPFQVNGVKFSSKRKRDEDDPRVSCSLVNLLNNGDCSHASSRTTKRDLLFSGNIAIRPLLYNPVDDILHWHKAIEKVEIDENLEVDKKDAKEESFVFENCDEPKLLDMEKEKEIVEIDLTLVDLEGLLPTAIIMVVSVTASTTSGKPLPEDVLQKTIDACDRALALDSAKKRH